MSYFIFSRMYFRPSALPAPSTAFSNRFPMIKLISAPRNDISIGMLRSVRNSIPASSAFFFQYPTRESVTIFPVLISSDGLSLPSSIISVTNWISFSLSPLSAYARIDRRWFLIPCRTSLICSTDSSLSSWCLAQRSSCCSYTRFIRRIRKSSASRI